MIFGNINSYNVPEFTGRKQLLHDVWAINIFSSAFQEAKPICTTSHESSNNSALKADKGSSEEQSINKSNVKPNEFFARVAGVTIYEFHMKKLAMGLTVQINSCSCIHGHTLSVIGLDTLCIHQQDVVFIISWSFVNSLSTKCDLMELSIRTRLDFEPKFHQNDKAWIWMTSTPNSSISCPVNQSEDSQGPKLEAAE